MASGGLKEMGGVCVELRCLARKLPFHNLGLRLFCQWPVASVEPQWITELNIAALLVQYKHVGSYLYEN
jgi:hypothetical protein